MDRDKTQQLLILLDRIANSLEKIAYAIESINFTSERKVVEDLKNDEEDSEDRDIILTDFLANRGITIKTIAPEQESDEILDKLAVFIGSRFSSVKSVLDIIKSNMNAGKPFKLSIKDLSQTAIADCTLLCTNLYSIALLTSYFYQKSPIYLIHAIPNTSPKALNFFSGQWLERFVKTQILSLLRERRLKYAIINNAQISLPNGDDFELDVLCSVEESIFWIEAKSGDYQRHIDKYAKMSKIMGLDKSHIFLVLTDSAVSDVLAEDLTKLYGITVSRIEKFAEHFATALPAKLESITANAYMQ